MSGTAIAALLLVGLLGTAALAAEEPGTARQEVRIEGGRLSVELERAPAARVFRALAEQGGMLVRLDRSLLEVPLTTRFDDVPLDRGLRRLIRLLQTDNFTIEFLGDRVERVEVLAATGPREAEEYRPAAAKAAEGEPALPPLESGGIPKGVRKQMERGLTPGQQRAYARTGRLPRDAIEVPEGLRLKKERGEPMPPGSAWKLEQALRLQQETGQVPPPRQEPEIPEWAQQGPWTTRE
ncbi:MAG: hypothetical protein HY658_10465 [Actinobacteria bacterium]|nr:hypothetical protein [Actinomycetota bacterium]